MGTRHTISFQRRKFQLTLLQQDLDIRSRFPGFSYRRIGSTGVWKGKFSPRPSSPEYTVEVQYKLGKVPRVRVLQPALHLDAPHRYEKKWLCLYYPKDEPWRSGQSIAKRILPLVWSWLGYYELWLDGGAWLGPESPHRSDGSEPK